MFLDNCFVFYCHDCAFREVKDKVSQFSKQKRQQQKAYRSGEVGKQPKNKQEPEKIQATVPKHWKLEILEHLARNVGLKENTGFTTRVWGGGH